MSIAQRAPRIAIIGLTGSAIVKADATILGKQDLEFVDTGLSLLTSESILPLELAGKGLER